MRRSLLILATVLLTPCVFSQADFDCYPDGLLPGDPSGGCEGLASNGLSGFVFGGVTGVTSASNCGFPTLGLKYGVLYSNGPVTVPNGGPYPWGSLPSTPPAEIRIPIPVGATTVSFDWEYFNAESFGSSFNDGFSVAVLASNGVLVQQLVYADNQVPLGSCTDFVTFATEITPIGAQNFTGALPPLTGCEYLSVVCWNDGDNAVSGAGYIDNVQFNSVVPGCPVPCFAGAPTLTVSSPSGLGCIQVNMGGLPSNGSYFLAVSLVAGNFPNGWFNGIDIPFTDLINQVNFGFPFSGPANACGGAQVGEFCGAPSGLTIYTVALGINGPTLGPWSIVTPAAAYTIP